MIGGSDDGWSIVVDGFRIEQNRAIEGLFTLGSGYLHIRGSLEEHFDDDPQNVDFTRLPANVTSEQFRTTKAKWGTYVPGVYGQHPLLGNELVNLPWFLGVSLTVDGERLDPIRSDIREYRRVFHLKCGWNVRRFEWNLANGNRVRMETSCLVSAARPGLVIQKIDLAPDRRALLEARAVIDADVRTNGFDHFKRISVEYPADGNAILRVQTDLGDDVEISSQFTFRSPHSDVTENDQRGSPSPEPRRAGVTLSNGLSNHGFSFLEKLTVVTTSRDKLGRDATDLKFIDSYNALVEHNCAWVKRWESCDVEIDGDPQSQLAIRTAIYHLLRCHMNDSRVAIDAKGYSGDAYWGRFFWDTEIFLLPFYLYTAPQKARTLVDFRVNTLPGARRNAARYGYPGARYAWESDPEGDECCPSWQYADHEVHVTADVVYGMAHFAAATGNEGYLRAAAADVLIETARYWMGRIDWREPVAADPGVGRSPAEVVSASGNPASSYPTADAGVGRYISEPALLGVMGPDEYTPLSDNNAYTNRMVAFALERAAHAAEHCRDGSGTPASADEIAAWRNVAARLPIPRHPDNPLLVLQCAAFERLAEPRFDEVWKDRERTLASQVSQERLYRSKCLKQADVLMLMALYPHEFSDEEVRAAWDYYLPYTTHDSSLSPGVHALIACRLGRDDEAWDFWQRSCAVDLDIERGGAAEGVHIANFGAMWQIVAFGFAGVRTALQSEQLTLNPRLPEKWTALRFPLIWKGSPIRIEIQRTRVSVANRGERPIDVRVRDSARSIGPGTIEIWDIGP